MTPWVMQFFGKDEVALFEKVRKAIQAMPDIDLGLDAKKRPVLLSCHMLARALSKIFGLKYVDGYIKPNFEHSWLLTENGNVLDPYPPGILGGPILIEGKNVARQWYVMQSRQKPYGRLKFSDPCFRRSVRRIVKALKRTITAQAKS